jgi:pimeloyl-ACP methyl ester carboxylesterase
MNSSEKKHFVLVHGAWHGAWCWEKVVPLINVAGHAVDTIDLPGLGEEQTAILDVTLDSYVSAVADLIETIGRPVVLVGHSMGGMVITQVAEKIADKVDTLIYLTAFSPKNGETLFKYALEDTESYVSTYKQINEEEGYFVVQQDQLQECFYHMCSDEDANNAIKRLRPQALSPIATHLRLSDENYGRVRRCYIECSKDKALTHDMQKRLRDNAPVDKSIVLEADHSPFYSCPEELVSAFIALSAR